MRQLFFIVMLVFGSLHLSANDTEQADAQEVQVGDTFRIGSPDTPSFKHIDFPRLNFIIKRGGLPTYKMVEGQKVVVTSIEEGKDGTLQVNIERADGGKFFRSHKVVSAHLREALDSGELLKI